MLNGLDVEPIIGLEIHVQLATRTKLFCGCAPVFGAEPNNATCPVCLGLPGALPVMSRAALERAVVAALALNCRIAEFTKWDRKGYYYPDLPKNYQISQYDLPLSEDGYLEFPFASGISKIGIIRAHLEEDAGKNVHDIPGLSAIDLNRAGTPLLEIVTAPELRSADEVREMAVQLQRLVRYLGVSEAVMQKGQMRFEPNINVRIRRDGEEFRTPIVEVKNLNSFRALHGAVAYEIERQVAAWLDDGVVAASGNKSNRGWDEEREVTVPQREKEEAHDYRYFPDPDLVPVTMGVEWILSLREEMPELPLARTERFICQYKLARQDAAALVDDRGTADLLDHAVEAGGEKLTLVKQFLSFWSRYAHEREKTIAALGISPGRLAELANLVHEGQINATAAAQLGKAMLDRWDAPTALATELGLLQSRDAGQIGEWVAAALRENEQAVRDALANPKKIKAARGFLTGQVMKLSGGQADPKMVGELVERKLSDMEIRGRS